MMGYYIDYTSKRKTKTLRTGDYIDLYYSQYLFKRVEKEEYLNCKYEEIEEVG